MAGKKFKIGKNNMASIQKRGPIFQPLLEMNGAARTNVEAGGPNERINVNERGNGRFK